MNWSGFGVVPGTADADFAKENPPPLASFADDFAPPNTGLSAGGFVPSTLAAPPPKENPPPFVAFFVVSEEALDAENPPGLLVPGAVSFSADGFGAVF